MLDLSQIKLENWVSFGVLDLSLVISTESKRHTQSVHLWSLILFPKQILCRKWWSTCIPGKSNILEVNIYLITSYTIFFRNAIAKKPFSIFSTSTVHLSTWYTPFETSSTCNITHCRRWKRYRNELRGNHFLLTTCTLYLWGRVQ